MKKRNLKIFIAFIVFVMASVGCLLAFYPFDKNNDTSAADNYTGTSFSVDKVNRFAGISNYGKDPNSAAYFPTSTGEGSSSMEEVVFPISNTDQAVMLNNAEIENNIIEAIKISLLPDENYIVWLSPVIKLNGRAIDCSGDGKSGYGTNTGTIKYNDPRDTVDCYKFIFYIDLTNIRDKDSGELIQDTNGYYEISITYHYKFNSSQTTSSENVINFGIYLLDEVDYINSNSQETTYQKTNPRDNVDSSNAYLSDPSFMDLDKKYAFQGFYNNNKTYDSNNDVYRRTRVEPRL